VEDHKVLIVDPKGEFSGCVRQEKEKSPGSVNWIPNEEEER
jgi:hypothetical protein